MNEYSAKSRKTGKRGIDVDREGNDVLRRSPEPLLHNGRSANPVELLSKLFYPLGAIVALGRLGRRQRED